MSEESYLVPPNANPEKVWCQIDERGELSLVDWDTVAFLANQFDETPPESRTESMLIGKLMFLVRKRTQEECGHDGR
jgi:hypothetical protein